MAGANGARSGAAANRCAQSITQHGIASERATTPSTSDSHLRGASALSQDFRGRIGLNVEGSRLYSYGCLREGGGFSRATWWSGRVAAFSTCELLTNATSPSAPPQRRGTGRIQSFAPRARCDPFARWERHLSHPSGSTAADEPRRGSTDGQRLAAPPVGGAPAWDGKLLASVAGYALRIADAGWLGTVSIGQHDVTPTAAGTPPMSTGLQAIESGST